MAIPKQQRRELLAMNLPQSNRVRKEVEGYLARTGLECSDLAVRIGYSPVSLRKFMSDTYAAVASNDAPLRKALLDFMSLYPIAAGDTVDGRLYETANVRLLRKYFHEALNRGRAYYVEGDPGTQKSFVLQHLVSELNRAEAPRNGHARRAYYIYCSQGVRPTQLLKAVAEACGTLATGDTRRIIRNLRFDFRSRRALFIFDEAQHLDVSCLETLRELLDRPPYFGLLFAGSHQLERMFVRHSLELEQWNSRFNAGKRLPGISEDEAAQIVRSELGEQAKPALVERVLKGARAKALSSDGQHEYISARRLFNTIRDLKEPAMESAS